MFKRGPIHPFARKEDPQKRSFFNKISIFRRYLNLVPYTLKRTDKIAITLLLWVILICLMGLGLQFYLNHSHVVPAFGGSYSEGIVGKPKYINPLLCQTNDADRDLCALIFSGLVKYNQDRQIEGDLADHWKVDKQKRVYTFYLRDNLTWQDGKPLTAADIVFTIQLIQHPDYPGTLKTSFNNVTVKASGEKIVRFYLKDSYSDFLSNTTIGILPKHIWEKIDPKNLLTAERNLKPIGAGPYYYKELQEKEDEGMQIVRLGKFANYQGKKPYLDDLTLKFYPDLNKLKTALNKKEFEGTFDLKGADTKELGGEGGYDEYHFSTPQYIAVFFNQQKSAVLEDINVRKALNYAIDRNKIIKDIFNQEANSIRSPILAHLPGFTDSFAKSIYSTKTAKKILTKAGWRLNTNEQYRKKNGKQLSFSLATSDQEEFIRIAESLRSDWEKVGVQVNLKIYTMGSIQQDQIRPREYQALLFGENLGPDSDLYPFWHSTQINDPGLNLSLFSNSEADILLEANRQTGSTKQKTRNNQELFKIFEREMPAVFVANPTKKYLITARMKGVRESMVAFPSDRLLWINQWYIKGEREWGK